MKFNLPTSMDKKLRDAQQILVIIMNPKIMIIIMKYTMPQVWYTYAHNIPAGNAGQKESRIYHNGKEEKENSVVTTVWIRHRSQCVKSEMMYRVYQKNVSTFP